MDLVGELATQSASFRMLWAAHDVRFHRTGEKRFEHPWVGPITLAYEALDLQADAGLTMLVYTAESGSRSEEALDLLGTLIATKEQAGDREIPRA